MVSARAASGDCSAACIRRRANISLCHPERSEGRDLFAESGSIELEDPAPRLSHLRTVRSLPSGLEEAMAGPGVHLRGKRLAIGLHGRRDFGQLGVDSLVVLAVDAEHWCLDPLQVGGVGRGTVGDYYRREPRIVGSVTEALATTPAESDGAHLTLGDCRQPVHVVVGGI